MEYNEIRSKTIARLMEMVNERDREIAKLKAAAQSAPAGEQPAPYGWVAAGQFFTGRESAVNAAGKTPCVEVYSRPQVLAELARSAERQAAAEELARQLRQACDELRALKSAPAGEREAVEVVAKVSENTMVPELRMLVPLSYGEQLMTVAQHERILAAWQRTRAAGVPEGADAQIGAVVWRYIDRMTDICTVDPAERILEQFVAEVRPIMLAAAPAQPAVQVKQPQAIADEEERARKDDAAFNLRQLFLRGAKALNLEPDETSWFEIVGELEKLAAAPAQPTQPALTVWEGAMPESNGKSNFTAVLMRKGGRLFDGLSGGMTIARSEYPDRVRYEADRVRYLIGELQEEPCVIDYDTDKHSGYSAPVQPGGVE